ncbi:MAG: murein biosynthesis integral membrane protein MurJ [bacterium]|nr:murein biosynthesis integral membrane protein MurJ [bacterium]
MNVKTEDQKLITDSRGVSIGGERRRVAGAAGIVMAGMLLSRILGYVREMQIARSFGADYQTDAFWAAFMVPDLLYNLLAGGALSAAFIPVFSEYINNGKEKDAWKLASGVINVMLCVLSLAVLSIVLFTPAMVGLVTQFGPDNPSYLLCVKLTRLMAPILILHAVNGLATAMLQSRKNFFIPAMIWLIYNVAIIIAALLANGRIEILTYGVLAGAALMVLSQLLYLRRQGMQYSLRVGISNPGVKQVLVLFPPAMFGLTVNWLSLTWLPQFFGSGISEGVVTYIRYATRVIILPVGMFAIAISTAVFPYLSDINTDIKRFKHLLASGLRAILIFAIPSTVGLIVLRLPITDLLWAGGKFSSADVTATASLTMFFALGLGGPSALPLIARGFYARKDTITPALVGIGGLAVNAVLMPLMKALGMGADGIAIAASAAVTFNMLALVYLLRRQLGALEGRETLLTIAKVTFSSGLMALAITLSTGWLSALYSSIPGLVARGMESKLHSLFITGGSMGIGVLVFGVAIVLARIPETDILRRAFIKKEKIVL